MWVPEAAITVQVCLARTDLRGIIIIKWVWSCGVVVSREHSRHRSKRLAETPAATPWSTRARFTSTVVRIRRHLSKITVASSKCWCWTQMIYWCIRWIDGLYCTNSIQLQVKINKSQIKIMWQILHWMLHLISIHVFPVSPNINRIKKKCTMCQLMILGDFEQQLTVNVK